MWPKWRKQLSFQYSTLVILIYNVITNIIQYNQLMYNKYSRIIFTQKQLMYILVKSTHFFDVFKTKRTKLYRTNT